MNSYKLRAMCLGLVITSPGYATERPAVLHLELTVSATGRVTQCRSVGITGQPRGKVDVREQCRVQSYRWFGPNAKRPDGKRVRGSTIVIGQLLDAIS